MAGLALRLDAPIVFAYAYREGRSRRHVFRAEAVLEPARTGDREADERRLTQRMTSLLEAAVRRHPEQWLWVHRRWKQPRGARPVASGERGAGAGVAAAGPEGSQRPRNGAKTPTEALA